jgi:hypothetical protein
MEIFLHEKANQCQATFRGASPEVLIAIGDSLATYPSTRLSCIGLYTNAKSGTELLYKTPLA